MLTIARPSSALSSREFDSTCAGEGAVCARADEIPMMQTQAVQQASATTRAAIHLNLTFALAIAP
jgi:hypothetical protein